MKKDDIMKISIETVFKTENPGSFLQAWALKTKLEELGNEVYFSDYKKQGNTFRQRASRTIKCCIKGRFQLAFADIMKGVKFHIAKKVFKVRKQTDHAIDLHIFGSDTIWNIEDELFYEYADFFTGKNVNKPCYSFSASVGSTSKETFIQNSAICEQILKFKKVAVRDEQSHEVLSAFYPKENIVRTIDPTLLISQDAYVKHFQTKRATKDKYLLIYYFGALTDEMLAEIKNFAKEKNLKIVRVGLYDRKADVSIISSPENFISAFYHADYILTNTFHGCVFSTIFNKQFITDAINKKKVLCYLEQFSLTDRIMKAPSDFKTLMLSDINYETVNEAIQFEAEKSTNYLKEIIKGEESYEQ